MCAARDEAGWCRAPPARRPGVIDAFLPKLEELVERSKGKVRADVAHEKITAMGYAGSERTTRRAVARLKAAWHCGPAAGVPAVGPRAGDVGAVRLRRRPADRRGGDGAVLPVAGLVPVPGGAAAAGQDPGRRCSRRSTWRCAGSAGCPTYLLTDNEKTVTVEHVAGIPVRNPGAVEFGRHYGLTVATCVPYDPASKGGSESTVKIAKADLVPDGRRTCCRTTRSFAGLEAACEVFCEQVNARPHRVTRRAPAEMLAEERARLHPVPAAPFTAALGVTRRVDALSLVTFEGGQYSVPHQLAGQAVWVRRHGEQVVIAHAGPDGPAEVARHLVTTPGSPRRRRRALPAARRPARWTAGPRPRTAAEARVPGHRGRRRAVAGRGRRRRREPGPGQDGPGRPAGRACTAAADGRPGAGAGRRRGPVRRRRPRPPILAHQAAQPRPARVHQHRAGEQPPRLAQGTEPAGPRSATGRAR